jgi:hypothetical protein
MHTIRGLIHRDRGSTGMQQQTNSGILAQPSKDVNLLLSTRYMVRNCFPCFVYCTCALDQLIKSQLFRRIGIASASHPRLLRCIEDIVRRPGRVYLQILIDTVVSLAWFAIDKFGLCLKPLISKIWRKDNSANGEILWPLARLIKTLNSFWRKDNSANSTRSANRGWAHI